MLTDRVRSTRGGYIFSLSVSSHLGGGGYPIQLMGGYPIPGPDGGYPIPGPGGGTASQVQVGVPHHRSRSGYPILGSGRGAPTQGTPWQGAPTWGIPLAGAPTWGTPQQGASAWGTPQQGGAHLGYPQQGTPAWSTPQQGATAWGTPQQEGAHLGYPPWQEVPARVPPRPPSRSSIACTCYAVVGMPLVFTQEDFLVSIVFNEINIASAMASLTLR